MPNKEAGVSAIVRNLLLHRQINANIEYRIVLLNSHGDGSSYNKVIKDFKFAEVLEFDYSVYDNSYLVLKKLGRLVTSSDDIIVDNDGLASKMVHYLGLKNALVYILHGDFEYYYNVLKEVNRSIDLIITYSIKMNSKLRNLYVNNRIEKIYYPAGALVSPSSSQSKANKRIRLIFVGSLDERKGAHKIGLIYDKIVERVPVNKFELSIVGGGDLFESILKRFCDVDNVSVLGWQDNTYVMSEFLKSDIVIFPSLSEGLPNVLVEALVCGCIPVAFEDVSGVEDLIENGLNGFLVRKNDYQLMSQMIVELINNPVLIDSVKSNDCDVLDNFNSQNQASAYEFHILGTNISDGERVKNKYISGRVLDKIWIPNIIVRIIRAFNIDKRL